MVANSLASIEVSIRIKFSLAALSALTSAFETYLNPGRKLFRFIWSLKC